MQCGAIQAAAPTIKRPKITSAFELVKVPTLLLNVQTSRPLEALELLRRNLPRDEAGLKEWPYGQSGGCNGQLPALPAKFHLGFGMCALHVVRTWPSIVHRFETLGVIHRNYAWGRTCRRGGVSTPFD